MLPLLCAQGQDDSMNLSNLHVIWITDLAVVEADTCPLGDGYHASRFLPYVWVAGRGLRRDRSGSRPPRFEAELPGLHVPAILPEPRGGPPFRGGETNLPRRMIHLDCRIGPQQPVPPQAA